MNESKKLSRRTFLAQAGGSLIRIGLPGIFIKLMPMDNLALAAETRPDGRPRLPPGQQAVKKIIDMGGIQGTADTQNWKLQLHGEVERPTLLSFQELLNLSQVDITCDVHCVTGWTLLDSQWTGVRLAEIPWCSGAGPGS